MQQSSYYSYSSQLLMAFSEAQYERMTQQYLKVWDLVWQVPSITFTIAGALVAVSFQFLPAVPRIVVLTLASAFTFVMAQVTLKHRVTAAVAIHILRDIEVSKHLNELPVGTKEWIDFLKQHGNAFKNVRGDFPEWIFQKSSEFLLVYLLLLTGSALAFLALDQIAKLGVINASLFQWVVILGGVGYAISQILSKPLY